MSLFGLKIVPHPLAVETRTSWHIERHPIPKKRRNWRVVKQVTTKPCAFVAGSVVYMHPDLIAKLKGNAS